MQLVKFDYADKLLGICGACCISAFLQSACPSLIVGAFQAEQAAVSWLARQKLAVVFKTFVHVTVFSKAFLCLVIIVIRRSSSPIVTLYSEMVVALTGQFTHAGAAFKQSLCKRNARRYVVFQHLGDC